MPDYVKSLMDESVDAVDYSITTYGGGSSSIGTSYGSLMNRAAEGAGVWILISMILAIIGGVLVYFLFVKSPNRPKGKFLKWLKDFLAFKTMWIEAILKIVYYVATIFAILGSFAFLSLGGAGVMMWLITMVLGPVCIRVVYEMSMMFIMIWRNTRDIAENTKKK